MTFLARSTPECQHHGNNRYELSTICVLDTNVELLILPFGPRGLGSPPTSAQLELQPDTIAPWSPGSTALCISLGLRFSPTPKHVTLSHSPLPKCPRMGCKQVSPLVCDL